MGKAPERCLYCDHNDPDCGFCEMGVPLDTQKNWRESWGKIWPDFDASRLGDR